MKPVIGFAGLGHLGEHSKSAAFQKGFKTIGYEVAATACCASDLKECDIVYVSPDRPGRVEPQEMTDLILPYLREDAILTILCQVGFGSTRKINWPSGHLYYQVETLRMSDAEERALNPERIIIGCADPRYIDYRLRVFLDAFNCPVLPMSYESAELAKIAINIYLASQVSTTNTLAEIAEKIGADWNEIIPALKTDKRIGKEAYLSPGYGLSPHLLRDLKALMNMEGNMEVINSYFNHSEYRKSLVTSPQ